MSNKSLLSTEYLAISVGLDFSASQLVEICDAALERVSLHLKSSGVGGSYAPAKWDDDKFWNVCDSPEKRSQYLAVGNAINFRFWELIDGQLHKASGTKGGVQVTGAMYMWRSLRVALDARRFPILDASYLADLPEEDFREIFQSDDGRFPLRPGLDDRLANLRDLGARLQSDWGGQFLDLLRSCEGKTTRLVERSRSLRAFDDPILKLTMVNAILQSGSGLVEFDSHLLPAVDYQLLKQLLRTGVLVPGPHLESTLKRGQFLSVDESKELRRTALKALVLICTSTGISGEILDNRMWLNRSNCTDEDPVCLTPSAAHRCPVYGACEQVLDYGIPLEETRYY